MQGRWEPRAQGLKDSRGAEEGSRFLLPPRGPWPGAAFGLCTASSQTRPGLPPPGTQPLGRPTGALQPDPKPPATRRPPWAGSLEHGGSHNPSPCSGGHGGHTGEISRGGPSVPCKMVPRPGGTHTGGGLAEKGRHLTWKHQSCRTSRPCSA